MWRGSVGCAVPQQQCLVLCAGLGCHRRQQLLADKGNRKGEQWELHSEAQSKHWLRNLRREEMSEGTRYQHLPRVVHAEQPCRGSSHPHKVQMISTIALICKAEREEL